MAKERPRYRQRIPYEHEGIQVNFCKKPSCNCFGVPAQVSIKGLKLPHILDDKTGKKTGITTG